MIVMSALCTFGLSQAPLLWTKKEIFDGFTESMLRAALRQWIPEDDILEFLQHFPWSSLSPGNRFCADMAQAMAVTLCKGTSWTDIL